MTSKQTFGQGIQQPCARSGYRRVARNTGLLAFLLLMTGVSPELAKPQEPSRFRGSRFTIAEAYAKAPMSFEANQGQTDSRVKFLSGGDGYRLFLTPSAAVLAFRSRPREQAASWPDRDRPGAVTLRMRLLDMNPGVQIAGLDPLPAKANYFRGNDPKNWRTDIPTYRKVAYRQVYRGIDLSYYGNHQHLEYDFVLAPGASPRAIRFRMDGASRMAIDAQGDLVLETKLGELRQHRPLIYQLAANGEREKIAGGYRLIGKREVGFEVAAFDASRPLFIDPVLSYSTFLGGNSLDRGDAIAVDSSGNAYITGVTVSADFPITSGAFQTTNLVDDVFIAKLNATGSALIYSTYLGGDLGALGVFEEGLAIAVDASGNAYVTGETQNSDFPVTAGAFKTKYDGGTTEGFLTKLNPAGSALVYSTYLGGATIAGSSIAIDGSGNAYVAGDEIDTLIGPKLPVTAGAFDTTYNGDFDGFVMKFNSTGSALVYATYLGGSGADHIRGIAVDSSGALYITGQTASSNFPVTLGAFANTLKGTSDAFVTKLNAAGSALVYATYLGGALDDSGAAIALDSSGNAYVTGWTSSTNFPVTAGAFQSVLQGGLSDAFVTKLDSAGAKLLYSTYLGGLDRDQGTAIALDSAGNAYVAGATVSSNFPTVAPVQATFVGGTCGSAPNTFTCSDAFVAELNPAASALVFSTFLGGKAIDNALGIAVSSAGNIYVTGVTSSPDFPTTAGALDRTCGSDANCNGFGTLNGPLSDAFVAEIAPAPGPAVSLSPSSLTFASQLVGTTSAAQTVTLTNSGTATLNITSIAITGANSGDFGQTNTCGASVAAGANCTLSVTFTPSVSGSRTASVTLTDDAAGSPQAVSLTGTGSVPAPAVSLSPASLTFASQTVGTTSAAQVVTLTNTGTATLNITSIAITGTNSGDFAQTNTCGASVAAGANCTISVTFTPSAAGSRTASVTITDDASDSPQAVSLTGTGAAAGVALSSLTLSPTSVKSGVSSTGTVTLSGAAPTGGAVVTLSSSNTTVATVPASVTVKAGATTATFTVSTKRVRNNTSLTISATYQGVTKTATLTVTPR